MAVATSSELTLDRVQAAVNAILETLGKPENYAPQHYLHCQEFERKRQEKLLFLSLSRLRLIQ